MNKAFVFFVFYFGILVSQHCFAHAYTFDETDQSKPGLLYYRAGINIKRYVCPGRVPVSKPSDCSEEQIQTVPAIDLYNRVNAQIRNELKPLDDLVQQYGAVLVAADTKIDEILNAGTSASTAESIELKKNIEAKFSEIQDIVIRITEGQKQLDAILANSSSSGNEDLVRQSLFLRSEVATFLNQKSRLEKEITNLRDSYINAVAVSQSAASRLLALRDQRSSSAAAYINQKSRSEAVMRRLNQVNLFLRDFMDDQSFVYSVPLNKLGSDAYPWLDVANLGDFFESVAPPTGRGATWFTKSLSSPVQVEGVYKPRGIEVAKYKTGDRLWWTAKPAVMADGTVVVGSYDKKVYWLKDGKRMFEFETHDSVVSSAALFEDGTVVIGSRDRRVYWLKEGRKLHEFETRGPVTSSPAILLDGTVVAASLDGKVYWLKDGKKTFEFETGGEIWASPSILSDGTVVIGSYDHKIYWLKDGVKVAEFETADKVNSSASVLNDDTVVIGSDDNKIRWLKNGMLHNSVLTPASVFSSPAVFNEDTIIVGCEYQNIYWLRDGRELHSYRTGHGVPSTPAVTQNGTVVVGSNDGYVYWLRDGDRIASFKTQSYVVPSPAILPDGTVVIGSDDGYVYWIK